MMATKGRTGSGGNGRRYSESLIHSSSRLRFGARCFVLGFAIAAFLMVELQVAFPSQEQVSSTNEDGTNCRTQLLMSDAPLLHGALPSNATTITDLPTSSNQHRPVPNVDYKALFQARQDEIDNEDMNIKCQRYGYDYDPKAPKRRIFFGSMVANDEVTTIQIHATEAYGLYDVAVFSESDTTHVGTAREMRFDQPGKAGYDFLHSGSFGPSTKIHMTLWTNQSDVAESGAPIIGMHRERLQRNTIVQGWIDEGMTDRDIGLMSDIDETFTRDYLQAMRHCVLPEDVTDPSCRSPKILASSLAYEMSPECTKRVTAKAWFHPDFVLGHCIEGVGNSNGRVKRKRAPFLEPVCGYGGPCVVPEGDHPFQYTKEIQSSGLYPLFTGSDIREMPSGKMQWVQEKDENHSATGFHFHNLFTNIAAIRHKYETYAHFDYNVNKKTLAQLETDIGCAVRCVHGIPNEARIFGSHSLEMKRPVDIGYENSKGSKPIFFLNETYRKERHEAVVRIILQDEEEHGPPYNETIMAYSKLRKRGKKRKKKKYHKNKKHKS